MANKPRDTRKEKPKCIECCKWRYLCLVSVCDTCGMIDDDGITDNDLYNHKTKIEKWKKE